MVDSSYNGVSPQIGVAPDDLRDGPAPPQRRFLFAQDTPDPIETPLPVAPSTEPDAPAAEQPAPTTDPPADAPDASPHPPAHTITDASLVVPPGVALMLDTALHGDRAAHGTPDADGRPRAKNLAILVGTIRTATFGAGRRTRARTTRTPFGTFDHAYFLTINAVVGDATGADRTSYRLPISMSEAVYARHQDLLVDGQRGAVLGPVSLEERYDSRFRRDAYDAGRPVWDVRLDVLAVQEVDVTTPDMGIVQFEGEVAEVARYVSRPAGPYGLRETYALVYLRARELLPAPYGMARRPVVRVLPVEVLVDPDEELIPNSDALLRVGNKVRIEGHLGIRVQRLRSDETDVQAVLGQVAQRLTQRNAAALQREQAIREANRQQPLGQHQALDGPRALSDEALERRIYTAQQNLLSMPRVRIEVGAVELLSGTPLGPRSGCSRCSSAAYAAGHRRRHQSNRPT
jgi:hypothetical protein